MKKIIETIKEYYLSFIRLLLPDIELTGKEMIIYTILFLLFAYVAYFTTVK